MLKRRIMDPIGASSGWKWDGYRNSTVTIDGKPMISVPGGGHWGGGIVISARDLALMGLLVAPGRRLERQADPAQGLDRRAGEALPGRAVLWADVVAQHRHAGSSQRRRNAATSRWAGAATSSGSIPTTTSSRCCAGSTASKRRVSSNVCWVRSRNEPRLFCRPAHAGRAHRPRTHRGHRRNVQAVRLPMGNGGTHDVAHLGRRLGQADRCCCSTAARARGSIGSATCCRCRSTSPSTPPTCRGWATAIRPTTCATSGR